MANHWPMEKVSIFKWKEDNCTLHCFELIVLITLVNVQYVLSDVLVEAVGLAVVWMTQRSWSPLKVYFGDS